MKSSGGGLIGEDEGERRTNRELITARGLEELDCSNEVPDPGSGALGAGAGTGISPAEDVTEIQMETATPSKIVKRHS
jgi:hypothetical protein